MIQESGQLWQGGTLRGIGYFTGNPASSGANTLVAAQATGIKIRVLALTLTSTGAVNAKLQSGAGGTDLTGLFTIAAAGVTIVLPFNPHGWCETAAATLLNLNLSGAVAVGVTLVWCPAG